MAWAWAPAVPGVRACVPTAVHPGRWRNLKQPSPNSEQQPQCPAFIVYHVSDSSSSVSAPALQSEASAPLWSCRTCTYTTRARASHAPPSRTTHPCWIAALRATGLCMRPDWTAKSSGERCGHKVASGSIPVAHWRPRALDIWMGVTRSRGQQNESVVAGGSLLQS